MISLAPEQYAVYGPPDAARLLLVHGSTVTRAMWWPQIDGLAKEFRVTAIDLPGHGASVRIPFTLTEAVDLLDRVVSEFAGRPVVIVGISLGGYVALEYAAAHPDYVAGLVLASTTVNFTGVLGAYIRLVGWLLSRVFSESWQRERLIHSMRRKYPAEIAEPLITAGLYPRATGEAFLALAGRDFRKPLAAIQCPLLFLNGEDDAASRRGEQSFVSVASHAQVEYIAAAGHLSNLQQPTAFTAAVRRFSVDVFAAHPRASASSQRPAGRHA